MHLVQVRGRGWRLAGLAVGAVAGLLLFSAPPSWLGLGDALAGPAFALCLLAGVLVGEIRTAPADRVRTASLEVRDVRRYLPARMTAGVVGLTVVLVLFLFATTLAGSSDDMGRPGRFLLVTCGPDRSAAAGPWPGVFYSAPILAAVLIGLVSAAFTGHVVARRRPGDGIELAADEEARRVSVRAILAACTVLTAAPLAGAAFIAGGALLAIGCGGIGLRLGGFGSILLAVMATVVTAAGVAVLAEDRTAGRPGAR